MTHNQVQEMIDAYVDGQLAVGEAKAVEVHLAECGSCADAAQKLRWMSRTLFHPSVPPTPTEFFVARVMNAVRSPAPASVFSAGFWRWPALALSLATVFLIATADTSSASDVRSLSTGSILLAGGGTALASLSSSAEPVVALMDVSGEEL